MKVAFGGVAISKITYLEILNYFKIQKQFKIVAEFYSDNNDLIVNDKIIKKLQNKETDLAIILENNAGIIGFIYGSKHKNIIAANCNDEVTAVMTRRHNNTNLLIIGLDIVGNELAKQLINNFLNTNYDGGRHQVRIDMLDSLLEDK